MNGAVSPCRGSPRRPRGTRDHVYGNHFADLSGRRGAGIGAALTAPTSPRTMTVTRPPPICSRPISRTLAAFTMRVCGFHGADETLGFDETECASRLARVVVPLLIGLSPLGLSGAGCFGRGLRRLAFAVGIAFADLTLSTTATIAASVGHPEVPADMRAALP